MTKLIFALALLFSSISFADSQAEQVLFKGTEKNSGERCSVSLRHQGGPLYTVVYRTESKVLKFSNVDLYEGQQVTASSLFYKEDGQYVQVIGAAIFPVGRYYFVNLIESEHGFNVNTKIEIALIFGGIEVRETNDSCQ